jgi:hypothetical protein
VSRPTTPQYVETQQGWSWTWRTREGIDDQVELEVELEWQLEREMWQRRTRIDRAGWSPALRVDLDEPETFDHADSIARRYADREE